jgi:hypothetical protein
MSIEAMYAGGSMYVYDENNAEGKKHDDIFSRGYKNGKIDMARIISERIDMAEGMFNNRSDWKTYVMTGKKG